MQINTGNLFKNWESGRLRPGKDEGNPAHEPLRDSVIRESPTRGEMLFETPLPPFTPPGASRETPAASDIRYEISYPPRNRAIGFDEEFLGEGCHVPLPKVTGDAVEKVLAWGDGKEIVRDYVHFSLVMNRERKMPFFAACNIDGSTLRHDLAKPQWKLDEEIGPSHQIGDALYKNNDLDKGHLVRRMDVMWGAERDARWANENTFTYPNITPQHKKFNKDKWHILENWVLEGARESSEKLCVFTGPVFGSDDLRYRNEQIPGEFWKVVVKRRKSDSRVVATAFLMSQKPFLGDLEGKTGRGRVVKDGPVEASLVAPYHVSLDSIEGLTNLDFGDLEEVEPFAFFNEE